MKTFASIPICAVLGLIFRATDFAGGAQLGIVSNAEPQRIFFGEDKKISATFRNSSGEDFENEIHTRVFQTGSGTSVLLSEAPWEKLQILPNQTIIESVALNFPTVRTETRFIIQWWEGTNRMSGITEVLVYPTNLLEELKSLAGDKESLGVFDPTGQLKPLLKMTKVGFVDLDEAVLEDFQGKLAIIGPFSTKAQMREGLAQTIQKIARKGVAVVWIRPPPGPKDPIKPSFYIVPEGKGPVVVVQADLVANPAGSPQAQLNLVYFCKLALNPTPFSLLDSKTQP
jgi:hypothetical protein